MFREKKWVKRQGKCNYNMKGTVFNSSSTETVGLFQTSPYTLSHLNVVFAFTWRV